MRITMTGKRFHEMCHNEKLGFELQGYGMTFGIAKYKLHNGLEDTTVHVRGNMIDENDTFVVEALTELGALALELYDNDDPIVRRLHSSLA